MVRIFKDIMACYLIAALSVLFLFYALNWMQYMDFSYTILLSFIWIVLCIAIFKRWAQNRLSDIESLSLDKCQIKACADKFERLLKYNKKSWPEIYVKVSLSTCYLNLGEAQKAVDILTSFQPQFPRGANGLTYVAFYYTNLALCFTKVKDLANAEIALSHLKAALNDPKMPSLYRQACFKNYQNIKMRISMAKGDYSYAEQYYTMMLECAKYMIEKVSLSYTLAKIHMHNGDEKKAQEYISFVIENGGDSCYAQKAKANDLTY